MTKKIYHRNDARPALIKMGLPARRIFMLILAQIPRETARNNVLIKFDHNQEFIIKISDYAQLCDIDQAAAYRQLVEGVEELRGYVLRPENGLLKKSDPNLPKDWIEPFTIADRGTGYSKGEGFVKVKLAEEITPLISALKDSFTGQFLVSAMRLPEGNAGKLYLILREWISGGYLCEKIVLFSDFLELLGLTNTKNYSSYPTFRQAFFLRSIKKIIDKTEFTDIKMEISEKRARKAYRLKISYEYKETEQPTKAEQAPKPEEEQTETIKYVVINGRHHLKN